jgi:hypothetical protein
MAGRFEPTLPGWPGGEAARRRSADELAELADAVREHERIAARSTVPKRPVDHRLYRRLAEIEDLGDEERNGGMR